MGKGRLTGGGVAAEGERERERENGRRVDATNIPEMLCWLREDEMSVQELLQRVQCVITHVGESSHFSPLTLISLSMFHTFRWFE